MRFLLVDKILEVEPDRSIVGLKQVAMSEDYLTWHFPERPILPGNLIVEAGAQLAGWLEAASSDFDGFVLLDRVTRARFLRFVVPGERVSLHVRFTAHDGLRRSFAIEASVDGERCAQIECEGQRVSLGTLDSPDDVRRTYGLLRGEHGA